MDITYTYDGEAVELYSYNYNTTMEDSVYYENVDGEICQKFVLF